VSSCAVENWAWNGSGWLEKMIFKESALKMRFTVFLNGGELVQVLQMWCSGGQEVLQWVLGDSTVEIF
jgi:hypothetical protein